MRFDFNQPANRHLIGPVWMLPQRGSVTGGSMRPMNSYAVVRDHGSLLFDAPLSWTLDGIAALAQSDHPPRALVISHRDLASSGDAYRTIRDRYGLRPLLHPDDQSTEAARSSGIEWADWDAPETRQIWTDFGVEPIHLPGHSPGSIVAYLSDDDHPNAGGILLAGDSAVAPGPAQTDRTPRLERPMAADRDPRFIDRWKHLVDTRPISAILPLHGSGYAREDHPDTFDDIVANLWRGEPVDPTRR